MAANPPYDFMTQEEVEKEEYWWTYQGWMLFAGLICGVVANLIFKSQRNNLNYNSQGADSSGAKNKKSELGRTLMNTKLCLCSTFQFSFEKDFLD